MRITLLVISIFFFTKLYAAPQEKDSLLQKGIDLYNQGAYEQSIDVLQSRLKTAIAQNDKNVQRVIYNNLGNDFGNIGKTVDALKAYEHALSIAEELKDKKSIAKCTKNIGALYADTKDFDKALLKYDEAEKIAASISDTFTLADCANNKGVVFEQQKKYEEALKNYTRALALYQQLKMDDRIAMLYNNLGVVYKYLKNYDKSIEFYRQSLAISEKLDSKFMIAANLINIGNIYEMKGDYKKAIELNEKGLQTGRDINSQELIMNAYESLANDYAKSGDYQKGFELYRTYTAVKDSFISVERSKQLADMQTKYETEKKEKQIIKLEKARYQMLAVIGIMLLVLVIAFLLYNRQQVLQKQRREKAIAEAEYNERMRIAKDVHDDLGSGLSKISLMADMAQRRISGNEQLGSDMGDIARLSKKLSEAVSTGNELPANINGLSAGLSEITQLAETARKKTGENIYLGNEIRHISAMSRELIDNMRDLIWVLNPENTTLEQLVARLREYCCDYLDGMQIDVALDFPHDVPALKMSREGQRNIFLTVKESVNNSIKHSGTTRMDIGLKITGNNLLISVTDNGRGFNVSNTRGNGNGLRNMKQRIETTGGSYTITSAIGTGTTTAISVPLSRLAV